MEQQFIQFRRGNVNDSTIVDIIILRVAEIESIVPSKMYEGGCAVFYGDGKFQSPEPLEYFQKVLKPLGWEQK